MEVVTGSKRYTLAEAQQILLYRRHAIDGHDWQEIHANQRLVSMHCNCGVSAEIKHPTLPEGIQL